MPNISEASRGPPDRIWLGMMRRVGWTIWNVSTTIFALRCALEKPDAELAGCLAGRMWVFWYFRGHLREGQAMLTAALALTEDCELPAIRMESLQGCALFKRHDGNVRAARESANEAVAIGRLLGDRGRLAEALEVLGFTARVQGDTRRARSALKEAVSLAHSAKYLFIESAATLHLALLARDADHDCVTAWRLMEQSLALAREAGNRRVEANALGAMGRVARARADFVCAADLLGNALVAAAEVGDVGLMPLIVHERAVLACQQGQFVRGLRLGSIGARLRELVGSRELGNFQRELQEDLSRARSAVGEKLYADAWASGQAATLETAVAGALAEANASNTAARAVPTGS